MVEGEDRMVSASTPCDSETACYRAVAVTKAVTKNGRASFLARPYLRRHCKQCLALLQAGARSFPHREVRLPQAEQRAKVAAPGTVPTLPGANFPPVIGCSDHFPCWSASNAILLSRCRCGAPQLRPAKKPTPGGREWVSRTALSTSSSSCNAQ